MKGTSAFLTGLTFFAVCSAAYAAYSVANKGTWPDSWPKELEPLRAESRTLTGGLLQTTYYVIPFTKRDDFELAWPQLLKVKSKGAPIILMRSPYTWLDKVSAGVLVHSALVRSDKPARSEAPIPGVANSRERWIYTTYIELIVDGGIVDLNRIPLPADTPIIDERFKDRSH